MDGSAGSDHSGDKPWDHAWTTDEMREHRGDWTLAGDAGLLKHLQRFSDNLMERANKTLETLDSMNAELEETAIFIDNLTNTSLALANTQFIESRVYEDDVEMEKPEEQQPKESKSHQQIEAELIASIGESVRQGLALMDEKFERLEVVASDSEDEGEPAAPSVILRPRDPYQDRPLPYVIGSEKWKASSRVGLESSSSESEQPEEDESETDSHEMVATPASKKISLRNPRIARLSSSSSESNDDASHISSRHTNTDKLSAKNQDIFDSDSEIATAANSLPKNVGNAAPTFAEELAKRLGSVIPGQKSKKTQEVNEPSINQSKDDLFTPEDDEDLFNSKHKNSKDLFTGGDGLFDEEPSNSLWDDKPAKSFESNVIPPMVDGPPPISSVSTKPKSAIDDLFGDADSEESDDIFSSKTSVEKPVKKDTSTISESQTVQENISKRLLSVGGFIDNNMMTTSTPEMPNNAVIFDDEVEDDDLFGGSKKQNDWMGAKGSTLDKSAGSPAEVSDAGNKKKPVGGISIFGQVDIFASDFGSKLSSRLRRRSSSDSSNSDAASNVDSVRSANANAGDGSGAVLERISANGSSVIAGVNAERTAEYFPSSDSSGLSMQPPSINFTASSNMSRDFQPQMSSTQRKSEDVYRERVTSDSLFTARSRLPGSANSANNMNHLPEESIAEASPTQNDVLDNNDDIFGPPPFPKSGSKTKSTVTSLFDDDDSGDDLFSNTSSGSRSQRSADLLATVPLPLEKAKPLQKKGLFDDDNDLFGSKDSPGIDIFKTSSKSFKETTTAMPKTFEGSLDRTSNLFGDEKAVDKSSPRKEDTGSIVEREKNPQRRLGSIFDDVDDDDLFSPNFGKRGTKSEAMKAPNLFDDNSDDLFSAPTKSMSDTKRKPASETVRSNEPESPAKPEELKGEGLKSADSEDSKGIAKEIVDAPMETLIPAIGTKIVDASPEDIPENKNRNEGDDLFVDKKSTNPTKSQDELEAKSEATPKPKVMEKPQIQPKRVKDFEKESQSEQVLGRVPRHGISEPSMGSESLRRERDGAKREMPAADSDTLHESETLDESFGSLKREPPKTLKIRSTVSLTKEESALPRRVVSGKIKDLMGRMAELKIRSPTDVPPLLRKGETDEEDEALADRNDEEDGGCFSAQRESPPPIASEEILSRASAQSPVERKNPETAVSFDVPAQVETLAVTASKCRVRIQSKRRPQSRHARQSALRQSGIDFDIVDAVNDNNSDTNRNLSSNTSNNNPAAATNSSNAQNVVNLNSDRLIIPTGGGGNNANKVTESTSSIFADDRSDISFSKESSLSVNKNTLPSPSTDEDDLFDVPPDLPEDPPKEDTLFGRAPILSPIEPIAKSGNSTSDKDAIVNSGNLGNSVGNMPYKGQTFMDDDTEDVSSDPFSRPVFDEDNQFKPKEEGTEAMTREDKTEQRKASKANLEVDSNTGHREENVSSRDKVTKDVHSKEETERKMLDPLRDSSHDPLKDPSQLFAFVTKSPSPEKGKNLLFNEDDSLFSNVLKKPSDDQVTVSKKQNVDLFVDDAEGDLFSGPLTKRPLKDSKIELFDDDDDGDVLFGAAAKRSASKTESRKTKSLNDEKATAADSSKQSSLFGGGDDVNFSGIQNQQAKVDKVKSLVLHSDDELFSTAGKLKSADRISISTKGSIKDLFDDHSSGEDDMFAVKKTGIRKPTSSSSLFSDDHDDGDIFGKSASPAAHQTKAIGTRGVIKKSVTRDLRKTAEKIVEDPLSMLQED